ncbi:MAG: hypothetical protein IJX77_07850 [Ruminococcus sp.]|nr:hypothetical protein [Ruminococcus sp.]
MSEYLKKHIILPATTFVLGAAAETIHGAAIDLMSKSEVPEEEFKRSIAAMKEMLTVHIDNAVEERLRVIRKFK